MVEGRFNVLHEIPLRGSLLRAMEDMEAHWSVAALEGNEKILGEVDALCFLREGKTWLNAFEFKTSLDPAEIIKQEGKARLVISLAKMWLESRGIDVVSWSYTVVVRSRMDGYGYQRAELGRKGIGSLTWMEIDDLGRYIFRKIVRRNLDELPRIITDKSKSRMRSSVLSNRKAVRREIKLSDHGKSQLQAEI